MDTFKFYSKILDKMISDSNYWRYYFVSPGDTNSDIEVAPGVMLYAGATRACLVADECDEVIKWDIDDSHSCATEEETYFAAENEGYSDYLVPCRFLGNYTRTVYIDDHYDVGEQVNWSTDPDDWDNIEEDPTQKYTISVPLYAYEKIDKDTFYADYDSVSAEEKEYCRNSGSPLQERNICVAVEFLRLMGTEKFCEFSSFCHDYKINDLHCSNVGYLHGRFVIIDYAGYWN